MEATGTAPTMHPLTRGMSSFFETKLLPHLLIVTMSTTETLQEKQTVGSRWLDYLLMFMFFPALNKKYSARSQEPVHRTAMAIVYLIKTPFQALTTFTLVEYVFHDRLLSRIEIYLLLAVVIGFWELVFHRVIHVNKHVLKLLNTRRIRQHTQAFMKANPDFGRALVWISFFTFCAYGVFFLIYLGLVILTPVR